MLELMDNVDNNGKIITIFCLHGKTKKLVPVLKVSQISTIQDLTLQHIIGNMIL